MVHLQFEFTGNELEKEIFSKDYKNLISKITDLKNYITNNKVKHSYEFEKILGIVENQLLIIENELPDYKSIVLDIFSLKIYIEDTLHGSMMEEMDLFVRGLEDHLKSEGSILLSLSNKTAKRIDDVQIYVFILLIMLGANALIVGTLLSFYIIRNISSSIDSLIQITRKIKEGDLTVRADIKSNDEIAEFADSFNEMLNELADTQNRISSIFQGSGDSMCVIDDNFNILQLNKQMEDMVGLPEAEVVGKKCYKIFHGELCHTDKCTLKCILNGEKRVKLETDKETRDGKKKPVELIATPFKRRGKTIGVIESFRDITKRKEAEDKLKRAYDDLEMRVKERTSMLADANKELQAEIIERKTAEDALRREEEKFRGLYQKAPIAYFSLQKNGIIDDCNKKTEELFGYKREKLIGTNLIDLFSDTQKEKAKEILNRFISGNIIYNERIRLANKDGSLIWGSMTINAVRDQEGNMVSIRCMIVDITGQVNMEGRLMQAQRMESIGILAGGIAHDFNNLLMGVQGNVSLMQIDMDISHPYYKRLKNIEKQVQSGAQLTSHLLGFARKGKYEIKSININKLIENTLYAFGRTRKEITIHNELAENLFTIEADQSQIEQVLLNLYMNAADAMHGVGDLIIKTINITHNDIKSSFFEPKHGNYIMLMVTDTGTGIDQSTIEHIFDPFFTTKGMGASKGAGLGLASAYGIIKSHDGYIDVESKKGHGTTFRIYIPASEKKIAKAVGITEKLLKAIETVFLVDDEELILDVGSDLLEAMGYKVLTARDGIDAIKVYKKKYKEIDIVILDMVMPNMGGGEAYDRMKEINPDIKVLLASGYSIDGEATEILERGCNEFIQKPFNIKELSKKIREILGDD